MRHVVFSMLLGGALLCGINGCKTEKVYNNPQPSGQTTVIERDRPIVVDHSSDKPDVQNNIKVEK